MVSSSWPVVCLLQIVTLVCEGQFRHGSAEGLQVAWTPYTHTQRTLSSTPHAFDIDQSSSKDKELLRKQGAK